MKKSVAAAVDFIRAKTDKKPQIGLVLGSGLGDYANTIEDAAVIPYSQIPGMPVSSVKGHEGRLFIGTRLGKPVMVMQGRIHYYEGYTMQELTFPVRIMKQLGVTHLVLTNAAGGVNPMFHPGALMLLTDHINYSGANPLIGPNWEGFGPRFPDCTEIYDAHLRLTLSRRAAYHGIMLEKGVYMMFSGPSYETPSEIRMARTLGADAVGMSTVPEALAANHCGMKTIGIACITNMAAGILDKSLNHEEVMETAAKARGVFEKVLDILFKEVLE